MSLNINSFNEILLGAAKDDKARVKLLEYELSACADIFYSEVGVLLDELVDNGYESEQFSKILNIKNSSEKIIEKLNDLKGEADGT